MAHVNAQTTQSEQESVARRDKFKERKKVDLNFTYLYQSFNHDIFHFIHSELFGGFRISPHCTHNQSVARSFAAPDVASHPSGLRSR